MLEAKLTKSLNRINGCKFLPLCMLLRAVHARTLPAKNELANARLGQVWQALEVVSAYL